VWLVLTLLRQKRDLESAAQRGDRIVAEFDVAHLRIQGVDVVICFLGSSFDHKSQQEQHQTQAALQMCSGSAGLAGNVVLVWQDSLERFKFLAPPNQHPFFKTADFHQLHRQINKRLTCG
jgi:hypothetical protein